MKIRYNVQAYLKNNHSGGSTGAKTFESAEKYAKWYMKHDFINKVEIHDKGNNYELVVEYEKSGVNNI